MNLKKIIAGLFIAGCVAAIAGFTRADDDPIQKIATQLDNWLAGHPQEKVYLQLDKPYYAIGDDIWFKAYLVIGNQHKLSAFSGVLNVDLIDDKDSVRQRIKLPVRSGLTWGDFSLPDSLQEGNYRIRAYTNWMRNAGEDYFFNKAITIVNSITNNVFTKANYTYSIQNGQPKVDAVITYTDLDGNPYTAKPVSYQVLQGAKTTAHGKGITDDKGNLSFAFENTSKKPFTTGSIVTDVKLSDKKTVQKSVILKATSGRVDVQFFPEGGTLINGNDSKVAFKAVGADGLGADVKGVVVDDQDKQVATFASTHLGMGVFSFMPENGRTYKAKLTYADGSQNTVNLPAATSSGYTLVVENSNPSYVTVKIVPGAAVNANGGKLEQLSLIAQSGGVICYAGKSSPDSKSFSARISKKKFPTGIVQFTLFSSTAEPLNERVVFIQNHDDLKLDVTASKTYAPRQQVKMEMSAKDKDDKPVVGSFSVAITNETNVPVDEQSENSILSNLLLTADIKGYVEKPNYYFTSEDDKTRADLDVLMLTQGYRRFEWKQVMNNGYPPITYEPEKSLSISGYIKTLGGKAVPNGKVSLLSTKGGMFLIDTVADNEGKFAFPNLIFSDSMKFVIQARTVKDRKNVQIDLDNTIPQPATLNKNAPDMLVNISEGLSPFLQDSKNFYNGQLKYGIKNNAILLKEVVIKEKKENKIHSDNLNGAGNADQIVTSKQIDGMGCAFLTDCLQSLIHFVTVRNGLVYSTRSPNHPMQVIIDGNPVDATFLSSINTNDIATIEVLRSGAFTAIYGGRGAGGILLITTKRGDEVGTYQHYAPGIITYLPKGYSKIREFYSPQYDNPKTNAEIPDLRSTIYWKPNIITDQNGKASFDYFNADNKGTYRVVIEGIDVNGNLGRQVYRYVVK